MNLLRIAARVTAGFGESPLQEGAPAAGSAPAPTVSQAGGNMEKLEVKHLKREDGMDYWSAKGTLSTGKRVDCVLWTEVDGRDGGFEDEENVDIEVGGEEWDEIISSEEMNQAFEAMSAAESHHFSPREGDDVTIKPLGDGKWRVEGVLGEASGPATLRGTADVDEDGAIDFVQDDGSELSEDVLQEIVEMIGEANES